MSTVLSLVLFPALAAVLTAVLSMAAYSAAHRAGALSSVRSDRWHRRPTAHWGGVAIFLGFTGALAAAMVLRPDGEALFQGVSRGAAPWAPFVGLLAASLVAFLIGLADDVLELPASTKLAGQVAAGAVLIFSGIVLSLTRIYLLDVVISLFWFVGLTNALNLLDNMDGLAGGIGAIAAAFLGLDFLLAGDTTLALLSFSLMGALLGFLVHNRPPARIFMGDSGSLFIGLFLAGLALSPVPGLSRSLFAVMAVPVAVLAIPILDTTFVTVTRLLEGRPVSEGGRDHTSHGLVSLGIPEERALLLLWGLAASGGVIALFMRSASRTFAYLAGGLLLVALTLLGTYLLSSRVTAAGKEDGHGKREAKPERLRALRELHQRVPILIFALDLGLVALAYYAAYLIRWEAGRLPAELVYFRNTLAIVIPLKLLALVGTGAYAPRWRHYSLADALTMMRANLLGTLLVASVLLVTSRVGLSRSVVMIDFLVCTGLTVAGRLSFRFIEGTARRMTREGTAVAVIGTLEDAELAFPGLARTTSPRLRPVCVVDPAYPTATGRFRGYPVYGGSRALHRAVRDHGLHAAVFVASGESDGEMPAVVRDYLADEGSLDIFRFRLGVERVRL